VEAAPGSVDAGRVKLAEDPVLVANPKGNFSFLPAIEAFSAGAVAMPGHEVIHVAFASPPPLRKGYELIDRFLRDRGRPAQALCGIELRSPRPMTLPDFEAFNRGYVELLKERDIFVDGVNPVARTNVAPVCDPPSEASLYAFSFTEPSPDAPFTFIGAGGGDRIIQSAKKDGPEIVAEGTLSHELMREKVAFVLGLMDKRLAGLGVDWSQVSAVNVYTAHSIFPFLETLLLPRLGPAKTHGVHWHFVRPPVRGMEFEMDVRGCRQELVVY
jgi:hypothetical protein